MNIKYNEKKKEEIILLKKAYEKLLNFYEIEVENNGLLLELQQMPESIYIYPSETNSKITKVEKKKLENIVEDLRDLKTVERKYPRCWKITINGLTYIINTKNKYNQHI